MKLANETTSGWRTACDRMLNLLAARGIDDRRILQAMAVIPRHEFVPAQVGCRMEDAYGDHPLPLGWGQTISQPYIIAYMIQALDLGPGQRVLEVGSGCGYLAAIMAQMGGAVTAVERLDVLVNHSRSVLSRLGYDSVRLVHGDGYHGVAGAAPFARIVVSCAPPDVPDGLTRQLADGGRMIVPVGVDSQMLVIVERRGDCVHRRDDLPVRFVPMIPESLKMEDAQ